MKNEDTDLENAIKACIKMVNSKLEDNPKKGVVLDDRNRIRYKTVKKELMKLDDYFRYKGCFSCYGCCGDCGNFDNSGHQQEHFGKCTHSGNKTVHEYDTCESFYNLNVPF